MISKSQLRDYISDLFSDFCYYDRKEDEDFPCEDVDKIVPDVVTKDELKEMFLEEIDVNF